MSTNPSVIMQSKEVFIPAIQRLTALDTTDNVPNIQFPSLAIEVESGPTVNRFIDARAYSTKLASELETIAQLDSLSLRGEEHVCMLYCFRSISKAIPMLPNLPADAPRHEVEAMEVKRLELHRMTLELLRPEIMKLRDLMDFAAEATLHFRATIDRLVGGVSAADIAISDAISMSLLQLLDIIVKLDHLKDLKGSIKMDFARYKRAVAALQSQPSAPGTSGSVINAAVLEELALLQAFISSMDPKKERNCIFGGLRDDIKRISNHEGLVLKILENALFLVENQHYVTPNEKFRLLRVMPHLILFLCADELPTGASSSAMNKENVFKNKNYRAVFARCQIIFRQHPVVPLYADMHITLVRVLERAGAYWDGASMGRDWGEAASTDAKIVAVHNLTSRWMEIREAHDDYLVRLVRLLNQNDHRKQDEVAGSTGSTGSSTTGSGSVNSAAAVAAYSFTKEISRSNLIYAADLYTTVKEGVQHVSTWTALVLQIIAWKLAHPADIPAASAVVVDDTATATGATATGATTSSNSTGTEYERALKYNFTSSELNVLVEIIAMIKSVTALLYRHEAVIAPILRFHMHHTMQQLVQGDLLSVLHRCDKRSKEKQAAAAFAYVMQIRHLAADWIDGKEPVEDYKSYSRRQGSVYVTSHPARTVSAGSTQLAMVRGCVRGLYDIRSDAMQAQGLFTKPVLESEDISKLQFFYYDSAWFPALLSMSTTLRSVSDVGDLLFREFYLDLTKSIQFPIEHSLPWILTEHVVMVTGGGGGGSSSSSNATTKGVNSAGNAGGGGNATAVGAGGGGVSLVHQHQKDGNAANAHDGTGMTTTATPSASAHGFDVPMIENIIYVLDIYNDAAHRALHELHQQYLYDEIEAEANLVFDQFVYLISDEIYTYYKNRSASQCLDIQLRRGLEELRGFPYLTVTNRRYEVLLTQKHVQLLGRSIDLNYLITQHINNKFYHDIDSALKRFESCDLASGIIELQSVLHVIRTTHAALSVHCTLDSFDHLLSEVNVSFSPLCFDDRITNHTCLVILSDLVTNYSYNAVTGRFVRSPVALKPVEYGKSQRQKQGSNFLFGDHCARTFDLSHKLTRGYVGRAHWIALIAVLGEGGLSVLIDKCMHSCLEKMANLKTYMSALHTGIPPTKQPQYVFKPYGCFGYFDGKLKSLLEYDDLKPEVFQGFRELGNILLCLRDLSTAVCIQDQVKFVQVAPLLNITPRYPLDLNQYDYSASPLHKALNKMTSILNDINTATATATTSAGAGGKNAAAAAQHNVVQYRQLIKSNFVVNQASDVSSQLKTLFSHTVGHRDLFRYCLSTLESFMYELDLYNEWGSSIDSEGGLSSIESNSGKNMGHSGSGTGRERGIGGDEDGRSGSNSMEFHRIWSALNFLFNTADVEEQQQQQQQQQVLVELPDCAEFGDSFNYIGCLFIHLLGQRSVFQLQDFATHVLSVHEYDQCVLKNTTTDSSKNISIDPQLMRETGKFIRSAAKQQALQQTFFRSFESVCPNKTTVAMEDYSHSYNTHIVKCTPPAE